LIEDGLFYLKFIWIFQCICNSSLNSYWSWVEQS